jgi:FtsH-binding integral membrane protein
VLIAAGVSMILVGSLVIFALQTKYDFTVKYCAVLSILEAFFLMGILMVFLPHSEVLEVVYAGGGAALFSVYLVVDIQLMMDGKRVQLSPDDYVLAAINLYTDIVMVFVYGLQIINDHLPF